MAITHTHIIHKSIRTKLFSLLMSVTHTHSHTHTHTLYCPPLTCVGRCEAERDTSSGSPSEVKNSKLSLSSPPHSGTERHTDTQTETQTDTHTHTDTQTDRDTDRHTHTHTHT